MYTVIYVMGYGRSGSTILDILLNQHPDALSVGEVGELYRWLREGETCACLAPIRECSFWRAVHARHLPGFRYAPRRMESLQRSIESYRNLPALLLPVDPKGRVAAYRQQVRSLFGSIAEVSGKRCIVDSSKSTRHVAGRALALERYAGLDVRAIHMVRDPRGVGWSAMRGEGSPEWQKRNHHPSLRGSVRGPQNRARADRRLRRPRLERGHREDRGRSEPGGRPQRRRKPRQVSTTARVQA